jgi:hypothetical protein
MQEDVPHQTAHQPPARTDTGIEAHAAGLGQVEAHLAEYEALRSEIEWLIRDASQYQTYALGLIAVLPPAFALLVNTRQSWLLVPAVLIASAAFCLFGYLFFRNHQEV